MEWEYVFLFSFIVFLFAILHVMEDIRRSAFILGITMGLCLSVGILSAVWSHPGTSMYEWREALEEK